MSRHDKFVPLPSVNEQSDSVTFGEMGLPVGFDIERIGVALPRLERAAHFGNLGRLTFTGFRGDTTEVGYVIGDVSGDDVATATRSVVVTKAELVDVNVKGVSVVDQWGYDWSNAVVKVNNAEIEERIRKEGDKWKLGLFDPKARAKYLDLAIKSGVRRSAREATIVGHPLKQTTLRLGMMGAYYSAARYLNLPQEASIGVGLAEPLIDGGLNHVRGFMRYGDRLPKRQWSILNFPEVDRYLAATLLLRTGKIIKVAA